MELPADDLVPPETTIVRQMVTEICALIAEDLTPRRTAHHALPVALRVNVALNFFTPGSFQGSAADLGGVSQTASHHRIFSIPERWCLAGTEASGFHLHRWIVPDTRHHQLHLLAIKIPSECPVRFINRKGYHSLRVSDHNKNILHLCGCFPGSCNDSFIFRQSRLPQLFIAPPKLCGWILGTKGYSLKRWLLITLGKPDIEAQKHHNRSHFLTRTTIQQAIGLLKMWFQCLDRLGGALQYTPARVLSMVVVGCAFHNMVLERAVDLEEAEALDLHSSSEEQDVEENAENRGAPEVAGPGAGFKDLIRMPLTSGII
ncbi:putative nuclease HARBI1 [Heterodontus francisci]|uniref:putative nuclease HARBI1 n=1 Tax=Heterodontus francisci TaxID=7792 RepID=UPI00355BF259